AAMGFLTLGRRFLNNQPDIIDDRIDVVCRGTMALTVGCARCHDHKFDPIPQKDYYSLYGVFANSEPPDVLPPLVRDPPKSAELLDYFAKATELQKREDQLKIEAAELRQTARANGGPDKQKAAQMRRKEQQLQREAGDLECNHPGAPARANTLVDAQRPHDYPLLIR